MAVAICHDAAHGAFLIPPPASFLATFPSAPGNSIPAWLASSCTVGSEPIRPEKALGGDAPDLPVIADHRQSERRNRSYSAWVPMKDQTISSSDLRTPTAW